jgi:hypothetical protein
MVILLFEVIGEARMLTQAAQRVCQNVRDSIVNRRAHSLQKEPHAGWGS